MLSVLVIYGDKKKIVEVEDATALEVEIVTRFGLLDAWTNESVEFSRHFLKFGGCQSSRSTGAPSRMVQKCKFRHPDLCQLGRTHHYSFEESK